MSAYDNPRMINDPRAAASANVGNMIGSALADIGKSYASMRATQKAKVERTQELEQKILKINDFYLTDLGCKEIKIL